ncbi:MAG: hypothetical protein RL661_895 [Pseudomonadota bacterium]|jgi:hypothetical protein
MRLPDPKPQFIPANIPESLKALPRWAPWYRYRQKSGKWAKAPSVSVKEPERWIDFYTAISKMDASHMGVGLLMTGFHDLIGIDLDQCLDAVGRPAPWAAAILKSAHSYAEVSPSGAGLRILLWGSIATDVQNHDIGIEIYNGWAGRFLTITGDQWPGSPDEVAQAPVGFLEGLFAKYDLGKGAGKAGLDEPMPDILEGVEIPEGINPAAQEFLADGLGDDRSDALHWAGSCLISAGLSLQEVFSILAHNEHAMAVALDHRRQDEDRALLYLWQHHVLASKDSSSALADEDDFLDLSSDAEIAVKRLALLGDLDYEQCRKAEADALGIRATALDKAVRDARKRGVAGGGGRKGLPIFRTTEDGGIICNAENTTLAVGCTAVVGMVIGYDEFRDEIMFHSAKDEKAQWQTFRDQQYNWIRRALDRAGFERTTIDLVRSAVDDVAHRNKFDTAKLWLTQEVPAWDGVPRVLKFHARYLGCEDNEWAEAVSEYLWTAMVGRVMEPGCQADMMPVWISDEGKKKSTIVATMAPSRDFVTLMSFHEKEVDLSRKMRGKLLVELAELSGMAKKEVESAKAWITKRHEDWTPKFKEFNTQFPRRFVLIGTTNETRFLQSDTGNRRFLPIQVSSGDDAAIERDRNQLWAEAMVMWLDGGVRWERAHSIGLTVTGDHMVEEPWMDDILIWMNTVDEYSEEKTRPIDWEFVPTNLIISEALRIERGRKSRNDEMRISRAMKQLGFVSARPMINGARQRGYKKAE